MKSTKNDGRQPVKNTEPTLADDATTKQDVAETAVQVRLLLVLNIYTYIKISKNRKKREGGRRGQKRVEMD